MPAGASSQSALTKLQFSEKILQKGKAATGDALQRRLKALHERLKGLDQDQTDVKSLNPFKLDLIHETILLHKDKGVKAYSACCIADMLRLYAPDAPYTDAQLKDIFQFFLVQITQNLKPPTARGAAAKNAAAVQRLTDVPFYNEYHYLLESLATIKSVCLIADLPGSDAMIAEYFQGFFSVVGPDMSKSLLRFMHEILTALIEESATLSEGVLETLLNQLDAYADTPSHAGFMLASTILRGTAQKLQRHILTHFADIQKEHAEEPNEEDMKALTKAHRLMIILYRHCPDTLLNAMSLLEENLRGDDVDLRLLTTRTVGTMFGGKAGPSVLGVAGVSSQMYRSTWLAWMARRADKVVAVRASWLQGAGKVIVYHQEMRKEVCDAVAEKLSDVDERVRTAACKLFGELDYEIALHHVDGSTLRIVGERLKDKKSTVSCAAAESLARIYSSAHPEIESNDDSAIRQFSWVPSAIYGALFDNAAHDFRRTVEAVTAKYITPLPANADDEAAWVDRLLVVCQYLDDKPFKALMSLANLGEPGVTPWQIYARCAEVWEGGANKKQDVKDKLTSITRFVASAFADPSRTEKDLLAFAEANDKRSFQSLSALTNAQLDLRGLLQHQTALNRRISQSSPELAETFDVVVRMASHWLVNASSISTLLKRAQRASSDPTSQAAQRVLAQVAKLSPPLLKSHVPELQLALSDKKSVRTVEVAIQALAQLCRADPSCVPRDKKCISRAVKLCTEGSIKQAKFAARFLHAAKQTIDCTAAIKAAMNNLDKQDKDNMLPSLASLAEFAQSSTVGFRDNAVEILKLAKDQVLFGMSIQSGNDDDELESWLPAESLDLGGQAKLLCVRLYRNYCMARGKDADVKEKTEGCVTMLVELVLRQGQVQDTEPRNSSSAAHLRLAAALALVKIAQHSAYNEMIDNTAFEEICFTTQDVYFVVRRDLFVKYRKYIAKKRHQSRWYIIPFLSAHDPELEVRELGGRIGRDLLKRMDSKLILDRFERPFVRLLLLLAHHPDFDEVDTTTIGEMGEYIELYMDVVANSQNVSLLYHLASRLKTVQDLRDSGDRLYILSELAQYLLQQRANAQNWTLGSYEGKQHLPRDIFAHLPTAEAIKEVTNKVYLPADPETWVKEAKKPSRAPREGVRKRSAAPKQRAVKPNKRRRKRDGDVVMAETDESESEVESIEEVEDDVPAKAEVQKASREERAAARRKLKGQEESESDLTDMDE